MHKTLCVSGKTRAFRSVYRTPIPGHKPWAIRVYGLCSVHMFAYNIYTTQYISERLNPDEAPHPEMRSNTFDHL